ncbi:Hint domain-containing protein [Gluconobacter sp. P1D12_c]|uniref:Hint domain-containing protein n=1 Tax=Gluconobacter sp. P1D12_c TaxID=2762614 RepID=UPI00207B7E65|nr:Hint domain-containing protein [Gluconobacter sp. P1D12_c]
MSDIFLSSGQSLNTVTIGDGDSVYVGSGASTLDLQLAPGGNEYVMAGGQALGTVVSAGGFLFAAGGTDAASAIVSGGTIDAGAEAVISENGVASSVHVQSGALLSVVSAGITIGSILSSGAFETVASGGTASATDIQDGGTLVVTPGGTVTDTTLTPGGHVVSTGIFFFSSTNPVTVSGMSTTDQPVSGAVLGSGAHAILLPEGVLTDADIQSGGAVAVLTGGILSGGTIEAGGSAIIGDGASATDVTVANGGWLVLSGNTEAAGLPEEATLTGITIENGGAIDVENADVSASLSGDILILTSGALTTTIELTGDYDHASLTISGDNNEGTLITLEDGTPCYGRGTLISTAEGEASVEDLNIGDLVRTASGALRPVRWIGRRSYSGRFASGNRDVLPVVFKSGSLGNGLPRRDLSVSPLHAMFLEGTLIPAVLLVNGVSILQAQAMDEVSYFHIELDSHDVLLAEGAPSESFIDDGSRGMFHNAAEYQALYPDAAQSLPQYCAPRLEEGQHLEEIRSRLNAHAGLGTLPNTDHGLIEGYLDTVTRTGLTGWARTPLSDAPVRLRLTDNGITLAEIIADQPRPDVGGPYGFSITIPGGFSPNERHVLDIQPVGSQTRLGHTPWILDLQQEVPTPSAEALPPRGWIDIASRDRISGWICTPDDLTTPVAIQIIVNGQLASRSVANARRPDVAQTGQASEFCGFDVLFSPPLPPHRRHTLEVRRETDGHLLSSPVVIEAANQFDPAVAQLLRQAVASAEDAQTQANILSFLLAQTETLKQAQAERESGRARTELTNLKARRGLIKAELPVPRVLIIDSRVPDQHRDAGSVAILSHMRALIRLGYAVSLVSADGSAHQGQTFVSDITVLGPPFVSSVEDVLRRQADSFDVVYLHRQEIATAYLPLVRRYQRRARVLYGVADLHHLRLSRQAIHEDRPELYARALRVRAAEYSAARQADAVLTHSSVEATLLRRDLSGVNVHQVPWDVPTRGRVPGFYHRHGIAFIGNFAHAPNIDAAIWLVETILPLVWATAPHISCVIAGAEMPDRITRLAAGPNVEVIGAVPDLADVLDRVRLTVAPLRYGAGVKGKVLDSLAAGVPCIMTSMAAEGLDLPEALSGLIADTGADIAARIIQLHKTRRLRATAARYGKAYIQDHHTESCVDERLRSAVTPAAGRRSAG